MPPGYPPPFGFPPPGLRFETRTERGLKNINQGLWLFAVAWVSILIIMSISLTYSDTFNFERVVVFGILAILSGILILVTIILWLIGFSNMYSGRIEYGPIHSHKVMLALIFIVVYIAISIVRPISSISFLIYRGGSGIDDFGNYNPAYLIMEVIFGFAAALFLSLAYVFLIFELASEITRIRLWFSLGLNLMFSTGGALMVFLLSSDLYMFIYLGSGTIVLILVMLCYWNTYERVRKRIIKPLLVPFIPPPFFPFRPPPPPPQRNPPRK